MWFNKVECTDGIAWYLATARMSSGKASSSGQRNASSVMGMILQPPCSAATISCIHKDRYCSLHVKQTWRFSCFTRATLCYDGNTGREQDFYKQL